MSSVQTTQNAVAAIRVSSIKQGLQGDSPEHQKEQIERFAKAQGITIKKFFIFMESASKEKQPVQEAIDYCKKRKNNIQLFIIKSIDRFTRGGSYLYDHLKMQLERYEVRLIDIYGIIGSKSVNTLEHLNIKFNWSVYNPTKKAEILEAERAKDEMRDIMTRMIGAEIRYVRMGYRVRRPPYGYVNKKIETAHGKRVILKSNPKEARFIRKMFEMRSKGIYSDREIVDEVNKLGFKTRTKYKRDPNDKTKTIGTIGGNPLRLKQFWRYIRNPIFAGISFEKWTKDKPVKGQFRGLVSIDLFNKANKGKVIIENNKGDIKVHKKKPPLYHQKKQVNNPKYPYKKSVLCPICKKPLYGSASRGKLGKYYPAYHCNKRGHYFRVPQKEFDKTIKDFINKLEVSPKYIEEIKARVVKEWNKKKNEVKEDKKIVEDKISKLEHESKEILKKVKLTDSESIIKYIGDEDKRIKNEIDDLKKTRNKYDDEDINISIVLKTTGYFLEHLEDFLIDRKNPLKSAKYFDLLFEQPPTYEELESGTPKFQPFIKLKHGTNNVLVPNGDPNAPHFEPIVEWVIQNMVKFYES